MKNSKKIKNQNVKDRINESNQLGGVLTLTPSGVRFTPNLNMNNENLINLESLNGSHFQPINTQTGKPYRGDQGDFLGNLQIRNGYDSNEWGTYLCWKNKGRSIMKGEKGISCFYPTRVKTDKVDENGEIELKSVRKYFIVFNKCQTSVPKENQLEELNPSEN